MFKGVDHVVVAGLSVTASPAVRRQVGSGLTRRWTIKPRTMFTTVVHSAGSRHDRGPAPVPASAQCDLNYPHFIASVFPDSAHSRRYRLIKF